MVPNPSFLSGAKFTVTRLVLKRDGFMLYPPPTQGFTLLHNTNYPMSSNFTNSVKIAFKHYFHCQRNIQNFWRKKLETRERRISQSISRLCLAMNVHSLQIGTMQIFECIFLLYSSFVRDNFLRNRKLLFFLNFTGTQNLHSDFLLPSHQATHIYTKYYAVCDRSTPSLPIT